MAGTHSWQGGWGPGAGGRGLGGLPELLLQSEHVQESAETEVWADAAPPLCGCETGGFEFFFRACCQTLQRFPPPHCVLPSTGQRSAQRRPPGEAVALWGQDATEWWGACQRDNRQSCTEG